MSKMLNMPVPAGSNGSDNTRTKRLAAVGGIPRNSTMQRRAPEKAENNGLAGRLLAQAKLEALRYQVNPHFLFNVLNSLSAFAKADPDQADRLIMRTSSYLRYILSASDSGFTSLRQELAATENYLEIEKVRFGKRLVVEVKSPPESLDIEVPELILQPIVENAVRYGMRTSVLPLRIHIEVRVGKDMVFVKVANTGSWVSSEETIGDRRKLGIENVLKRLELCYEDHYRFSMKEGHGLVSVEAGIPLDRRNTCLSGDRPIVLKELFNRHSR